MLNVNNIALVRYKTVNVATLDSIPQIVFSHTNCPRLTLAQSRKVSVSGCRCGRCTQWIMFMCKDKAKVSCGSRKQNGAHIDAYYMSYSP